MRTTLQLLGSPTLHVGPKSIPLPQTKPSLLLLYLAAQGAPVSRERLTYLFRPDSPEAVARHYLRNLLNRAKQTPAIPQVEVTAKRCYWPIETDLHRFREAIEARRWFDVTRQYWGTFLDGFEVDDLPAYRSWLEDRRAELYGQWRGACLEYASDQESSERHQDAAAILKMLHLEDRLDEEVLHAYLRNSYLAGQREAALGTARRFARELREEVGMEPLPSTQTLIHKIRNAETVLPERRRRQHGRRWTDQIDPPKDDVEELTALLKRPGTRLLTVLGSEHTHDEHVVVSQRVYDSRVTNAAIIELAECLIAEGAVTRATKLIVLVMTRLNEQPHLDETLRARIDRAWTSLGPHVPKRLSDSVKRAW